jgi:hypothetical protein
MVCKFDVVEFKKYVMSDVQELEASIKDAIEKISNRKTTPKKCGIGSLLTQMNSICPNTYTVLLAEYKPVATDFFEEKSKPKEKKPIISQIEKQLQAIEKNISFDIDDFNDFGELHEHVFEKAFDDASARIEDKKKKKTPVIIKDPTAPRVRNRQSYNFNGDIYGKGPLVLAVIRCHVNANPDIDYTKLKAAFPDELLKSYGIFRRLDDAQEASKKRKRYFLKDEQLVSISDCQVAVCNQFTSGNIGAFIDKAKELGYEINEDEV